MQSNNKAALIAALALGGCSSSGWWRDQPSNALPPPPQTGEGSGGVPASYPQPNGSQYPEPQYPAGADPVYPGAQGYDQGATDRPPQPKAERSLRHRADPPTPVAPSLPVDAGYDSPPQNAVKYDNVGMAAWSADPGTVAGAHPTLPPGSFVEVTALDTGRTILVPITAQSRPGREIELSGAAAQELGLAAGGSQAAVRVRTTNPTGADIGALKAGRPAPARPDTPPVLLNALRRKLSGSQGQINTPGIPQAKTSSTAAPARSMPAATYQVRRAPVARSPMARPTQSAPVVQAGGTGYYVQVVAIADAQRALAIAREVRGAVSTASGLTRVRFGPFDDLGTAQAARDDVARRGYAEARIVRQD